MAKSSGRGLNRRGFLAASAAGLAITRLGRPRDAIAQGIDPQRWTPDYIRSIAGTIEVDTAAESYRVVPRDYRGRLTYWYVGPNEASPRLEHEIYAQFFQAFQAAYPNIQLTAQNIDYNQLLQKVRTSALGHAAPMVARLPIMWGVEFAAKGQLMELKPEDIGFPTAEFWPGAMKSVTWNGKAYGIPTNNETMALIWNAQLFTEAGLNPDQPPATWADLVTYSKQIKDRTGKSGYGLVARPNAGNTPFRYMPQLWSFGGGALDEAEANPTYRTVMINNDASKAALQASYDMYVRDRSVPTSALTNTQTENQDPFIAGRLGMMISHPSEYAVMLDRAQRATGDDKAVADAVVANMRYGLIPQGPARRAVVFGGSNAHIMSPDVVEGGLDRDAARALLAFSTGPEWSTKLAWVSSNPGNTRGFRTRWMKERLEQIRFLNVTTSMLPYGVPFPVVPESTEIMNNVVPDMLQNALTRRMTVAAAADDAARKIQRLVAERG